MLKKIEETRLYIQKQIKHNPEIGIVLGTGLGGLTKEIETEIAIPYTDIPHFPVSTVKGHSGQLIFGRLSGKQVVAMQGRFHYYEGYNMDEVTFPIRVMKALGVELLLASNASGGINPDFEIGEIMFLTDHINLLPNPLLGKNIDELGPRFLDMSEAYSKRLINTASAIADKHNIRHAKGVYVAISGPTFETPAEYNYIRVIGGDAVGMSTVPEIIVARHMDMECFAVSVITDLGVSGKIVEVSHEDVIKAANAAEPKMTLILKELFQEI